MKLNVLFGGQQGQGVDGVASLCGEMAAKVGYYTFKYRDYRSLIKGGQAFDVLVISDEPVMSHDSKVDILLTLNEKALELHEDKLKEGGVVVNAWELGEQSELGKAYNMLLAGALAKILGLGKEHVEKAIKNKFGEGKIAQLDIKVANTGFENVDKKYSLEVKGREIEFLSGSAGIGEGAIKSGIDVYLAYPMTPATPVLHYLAGKQKDEDMMTLQMENELSVANAALGSAHTGAKTMVGSSGGGYDLMQEAMSMQGISEIPLVVYLSQRAGAGSGIPTYQAQGDLGIAAKGSHGEFPRVVIAPGDAKECIEATNQAFYFAEKYRMLSVLLGDKHVAESDFSLIGEPEIVEVGRNIDTSSKGGEFDNYKVTQSGNSPRGVPGLNVVKSTSYEHDEYGLTVEDEETINAMTEKRIRKGKLAAKDAEKFAQHKVHGDEDSDVVVVGWGSTKGAIKDAIEGMNVKFVQIIYLLPFPEEVGEILDKAEKVIAVENNSTGLLTGLIAEKTGYRIEDGNKILKYDGRPFMRDELKEKLERLI